MKNLLNMLKYFLKVSKGGFFFFLIKPIKTYKTCMLKIKKKKKEMTMHETNFFYLILVITGLAQRRYEPHLQDLVLLLNFNHWFTDR